MTQTQEISFEAALEQLQGIAKKLESGELTLDQSLQMFESGVKIARLCQEQLQAAEQKVELLLKVDAEGKAETTPFDKNS